MKTLVIQLNYKFSGLFYRIHRFFYGNARRAERSRLPLSEINKEKWYADERENMLRYEYDLRPDSIVIDVGGYKGDFAAEIFARYQSKIFVFEPVQRYIEYLGKRFERNGSVVTIPKGLGNSEQSLVINVMDEASSYNRKASIHKSGKEETIHIADVRKFFSEQGIEKVGLIKINIEGAEYDLLDCMINAGLVSRCVNLQIQFHDFYPDFQKRYDRIARALEKTHRLTYNYPFVWENWELKK